MAAPRPHRALALPTPALHEALRRVLAIEIVVTAVLWAAPARQPTMILVGAVANGLAAFVILRVGSGGGFEGWSTLGMTYVWGSAAVAAALSLALLVSGRPLLRRIGERARPTSMKVA